MDFYIVVEVNEDGCFLSEPDFFEFRSEAEEAFKKKGMEFPGQYFDLIKCSVIDSIVPTEEARKKHMTEWKEMMKKRGLQP